MSIAIITGASSGLGREYLHQLSQTEQFEEIWAIARRQDRLQELVVTYGDKIRPLALDLTKAEDLKKIATLLKKKLLQNIELTPSEIKFIKYQSADIIKAVISVGSFFIPIPGVGPMLLLLDKQMVSKYGFSIFPSDTEKKVFENILKK